MSRAAPCEIRLDGNDLNGNLLAFTDSVMGSWNFSYDQLNRLTGASASAGYQGNSLFCWSYDSFGNRLGQSGSILPFANAATCQPASGANVSTTWAYFTLDGTANTADNGLNRLTGTNARGSAAILTYDGAGDVTNDGDNSYLYDAEGRICAVNTSYGMVQYIYDAAGARVAKGTISTWSCDQTTNGFAQTNQYILGPNGEQLTEEVVTGSSFAWKHTNVYAAGNLIATYENDGTGPHFRLTDWLGTMRAQTTYAGVLEQTCTSLPFGDTPTPCITATEQFFTGKERDTESGLDYFGARYYGSNMGRFMSPDWAAKAEPVPYAKLDNPQSLNLYAYVGNNPLLRADPDGHCDWCQKIENKLKGNGWKTDEQVAQKGVKETLHKFCVHSLTG